MLYRIINGSITLGNKTILESIDFEIKNQEHVCIVGKNGIGKTTLLRAIYKEIELEQGLDDKELFVTDFPKEKIGYINQTAIIDEEITLLDEILKAYKDILDLEKKIKKLESKIAVSYDEKLLNQYQDLHLHYQNIGGYKYKKEYETALKMFGFKESDKNRCIKEFSYGWRTKIAFLRLILSKPDLLLLDEPTNHLDIDAICWLEKYLKNYPKMLIVVSHDRMFLDNICNVVYEIEYGSLTRYSGNYSYYEKKKKQDYEKNLYDYEKQQKEIERLRNIADRFRYKPTKASMAISKLKQIERMVKIDKPSESNTKTFSKRLIPKYESYREVLKVRDLKFGYDNVLGSVSFCLERGERLGIIGENGIGKSTFIKTIMESIPKLGGKFNWGTKVEIGYFDQNVESLNNNDTVLEVIEKEFSSISREEARNMLGAFSFSGEMVFRKVGSLSGGEKVKLLLCKIINHRPNVLILDEPTNHLDIISKQTIEDLLLEYKGTIIFVSHDRYFIKKIATNLLVFEKMEVNYYKCSYDEYLEKRVVLEEVETNEYKEVVEKVIKPKYTSSLKERSKLERKIKKIEIEIEKLEEKITKYHQEMTKSEVYTNINKMKEIEILVHEEEKILEEKMLEWEEEMKKLDLK